MSTLELILAWTGGPVATALGVGTWKLVQRWQASREKIRLAEIAAMGDESNRDERTIDRLFDRVEKLESQKDDCTQALAETQSLVTQSAMERSRAEAECREKIAGLEREIRRATADITGRIEIAGERAARRSTTPPGEQRLHLPPPRRSRRDDMDPKE